MASTSLKDLKKKSQENLDKLVKQSDSGKASYSDDDGLFWKPPFDKERGVGQAVIRFLDQPKDEDFPWVKIFTHGFKGPTGKWYIENSLTTINKTDPVGEMNSRLWNSGIESDKQVARDQKRRISFYSNILVIEDKENPENEGKVMLLRYGQQIFKIVKEKMNPEFEGEEPANVFDFWEGCNFVMKMKGVRLGDNIVPNYEKSYFDECSAIGTDKEIEELWDKCHSLQAFLGDDQFKTYSELEKRLFEVLGSTVGSGVSVVEKWSDNDDAVSKATAAPKEKKTDNSQEGGRSDAGTDGADDDLSEDMKFFQDINK